MEAHQITSLLEAYTAHHSNFDVSRDYISLSHCHLSTKDLINQYLTGFTDTIFVRLKCYKGYQMERDLLDRIASVFDGRIETKIEITAFGGLVKGHPDFTFEGYPADIKSVLLDDWLPQNKRLPRKVYYQMQGYMKYSSKNKALVIYETREGGRIESFWISANERVQKEIHDKLSNVVEIISQMK